LIRFGLTLIELVVALVLSSLLMAALLRITTDVARETRQLKRERTDWVAAELLEQRLRADLLNARGVQATPRSLVLAGFVSPQMIPGNVTYECLSKGKDSVLVRKVGNQSELCWIGCSGIQYEALDEIDSETPVSSASGGLRPLPTVMRIRLLDELGRVFVSARVQHHAS